MWSTVFRKSLVVGLLAVLSSGAAFAQEQEGTPPGFDEEMMKKWMEYATPGEHHKHLDAMVGTWKLDLKWWMAPDAEPEVSTATSTTRWILDGHYLQEDVEGAEEPGPDGKPMRFRGMGMTGYDNLRKEYFSTWCDNMGTGLLVGYGTCDRDGKTITFNGVYPDPMTGEKAARYKGIIRIVSKDKHVYEHYKIDKDGKETKEMEITYTRVK